MSKRAWLMMGVLITLASQVPSAEWSVEYGSLSSQLGTFRASSGEHWAPRLFDVFGGDLYIPDPENARILVVASTGEATGSVSTQWVSRRVISFRATSQGFVIVTFDAILMLTLGGELMWRSSLPLGSVPRAIVYGDEYVFVVVPTTRGTTSLVYAMEGGDLLGTLVDDSGSGNRAMILGIEETHAWSVETDEDALELLEHVRSQPPIYVNRTTGRLLAGSLEDGLAELNATIPNEAAWSVVWNGRLYWSFATTRSLDIRSVPLSDS